jgi:hypothetical protein
MLHPRGRPTKNQERDQEIVRRHQDRQNARKIHREMKASYPRLTYGNVCAVICRWKKSRY